MIHTFDCDLLAWCHPRTHEAKVRHVQVPCRKVEKSYASVVGVLKNGTYVHATDAKSPVATKTGFTQLPTEVIHRLFKYLDHTPCLRLTLNGDLETERHDRVSVLWCVNKISRLYFNKSVFKKRLAIAEGKLRTTASATLRDDGWDIGKIKNALTRRDINVRRFLFL